MTQKEKAKELVSKYITNQNKWYLENLVDGLRVAQAKQCALIAVDELIESHLLLTTTHDSEPSIRCKRYWQEVKQEIQAL